MIVSRKISTYLEYHVVHDYIWKKRMYAVLLYNYRVKGMADEIITSFTPCTFIENLIESVLSVEAMILMLWK